MLLDKNKNYLLKAIKVSYQKYKKREHHILQKREKFIRDNFLLDNILEEDKIFKEDIYKSYFVSGILHRKVHSKKFKTQLEDELRYFNKKNKIKIVTFDNIYYIHLE